MAILETLRKARNSVAHSGVLPLNVEMKSFQLCEYIHGLLRFFINNPLEYEDHEKVVRFISLTTNEIDIDEKIKNG